MRGLLRVTRCGSTISKCVRSGIRILGRTLTVGRWADGYDSFRAAFCAFSADFATSKGILAYSFQHQAQYNVGARRVTGEDDPLVLLIRHVEYVAVKAHQPRKGRRGRILGGERVADERDLGAGHVAGHLRVVF
jgi:hypothetical protein